MSFVLRRAGFLSCFFGLALPLRAATLRVNIPSGALPAPVPAGLDAQVPDTPTLPEIPSVHIDAALEAAPLPAIAAPAAPMVGAAPPAAAGQAPSGAVVAVEALPSPAPTADPPAREQAAHDAGEALAVLAGDERIKALQEKEEPEQALASLFDLGPAKGRREEGLPVAAWRQETGLQENPAYPFPPRGLPDRLALQAAGEGLRDRLLMKTLLDPARERGGASQDRFLAQNLVARLMHRLGGHWALSAQIASELLRPRRGEFQAGVPGRQAPFNGSLLELLKREAAAEATVGHVRALALRSARLYRRFFPEFFRPVDYEVAVRSHDHLAGWHDHANRASHLVTLGIDQTLTERTEARRDWSVFERVEAVVPGEPLQGRVSALLLFFHEYAHALFAEAVLPPELRAARRMGGPTTAFDAMTEGFAVMMELLLADKMSADRQALGLTEDDIADLRRWKRLRLADLRRFQNHYTIGTIYFWHKVYKREGEAGMLRFLRSLDGPRLLDMPLDDPGLLGARGRPELFQPYLQRAP